MSDTPAGWYNDGSGAQRYWDGASWTEHVAGIPYQLAPASAPRKGMPGWGWALIACGVLVVVLGLAAASVGIFYTQRAPINAANEAIKTYDAAWLNADCGALGEATTIALRKDWGYDDCSVFVKDAKDFDEPSRDYKTKVTSTKYANDKVAVKTTETYRDESGKALINHVTYTVIKDGDVWRIDAIDFADEGNGTNGPTNA